MVFLYINPICIFFSSDVPGSCPSGNHRANLRIPARTKSLWSGKFRGWCAVNAPRVAFGKPVEADSLHLRGLEALSFRQAVARASRLTDGKPKSQRMMHHGRNQSISDTIFELSIYLLVFPLDWELLELTAPPSGSGTGWAIHICWVRGRTDEQSHS